MASEVAGDEGPAPDLAAEEDPDHEARFGARGAAILRLRAKRWPDTKVAAALGFDAQVIQRMRRNVEGFREADREAYDSGFREQAERLTEVSHDAIDELWQLAQNSKSDSARVRALLGLLSQNLGYRRAERDDIELPARVAALEAIEQERAEREGHGVPRPIWERE